MTDRAVERGGIDAVIGKDEMIYVRNRYQGVLDQDYSLDKAYSKLSKSGKK